MTYDTITFEHNDRIALVTINRPESLIDVQLRTSEHRSMYSYVRLSIIDVQLRTSDSIDVHSYSEHHEYG